MAVDVSSVVVAGVMAVSNLGGIGLLMRWYMKRVDTNSATTEEHSRMLATASENQKSTAETLERVQKNISDLFDSRNLTREELVKIDTLHTAKGCKTLNQGGISGR